MATKPDEATKKYREAELYTACPFPADSKWAGIIRLQIQTDAGKTRWLNISPEEFRAIERMLTEGI